MPPFALASGPSDTVAVAHLSDLEDFDEDEIIEAAQCNSQSAIAVATEWTCPVCSVVMRGKYLPQRKQSHIKAFHPELKGDTKFWMRPPLTVKTLPAGCPAVWTCHICCKGISKTSVEGRPGSLANLVRHATDMHYRVAHPRATRKRKELRVAARQRCAKKMQIASRNKGMMNRLSKGFGTHRNVTPFIWPPCTPRAGRRDLICLDCKLYDRSATRFNAITCDDQLACYDCKQNRTRRSATIARLSKLKRFAKADKPAIDALCQMLALPERKVQQ